MQSFGMMVLLLIFLLVHLVALIPINLCTVFLCNMLIFFSLNRIRYQLDDQEPPLISPGGSGRKHNHSPLGLYRKPSPSLLPR